MLFQPGCTHALNLVLQGLLSPGDRVVACPAEHNAVAREDSSARRRQRGFFLDRPQGFRAKIVAVSKFELHGSRKNQQQRRRKNHRAYP